MKKLSLNSNIKSAKDLESKRKNENRIASIISIMLTLGLCLSVSIIIINIKADDYNNKHRYDNVDDGSILMPNGVMYPEDSELLKSIISNTLTSETATRKEKKELEKYLTEQDYDFSFINVDTENDNELTKEEQDKYVEFLKAQGIIGDEYDIESEENGLSTINGRKAISYKTLHEAEASFGENLGLYTYIDCLENYEMINAYTVGEDFLQCVYAINQDGTMITENQDIEQSKIKTITVKLSKSLKSDELIEVYSDNNYVEVDTITQEGVNVKLLSRTDKDSEESLINLAYFDREDNRSYAIHCADGIEEWQIKEIINELFNNLYIENLDEGTKQKYLEEYNNKNTWYSKNSEN